MTRNFLRRLSIPLALATSSAALAQDFVVPAGSTVVYDTSSGGALEVRNFVIEPLARLRVIGPNPFSLSASSVRIDGTLDASGASSAGVLGLNTTNQPEPGAPGQAGGGRGGTGSPLTQASSPAGLDGFGSFDSTGALAGGGGGGETSYSPLGRDARRGAGGGGGALASSQPVVTDPLAPENLGLVATSGFGGGAAGLGASGTGLPAAGGQAGFPIFMDSDSTNDFWGMRASGTQLIRGEAGRPYPGRGGGAGGDAVDSASFPLVPFSPFGDEKGAGGGGGGGLVLILARSIVLGPEGRISVDGGHGGGGENSIFFDRVGGGSGGGSGGWIVLEAPLIDLGLAAEDALTATGGRGGPGRNNIHDVVGAGGNGGPGVIQLHTPSGQESDIVLPPAKGVSDLTRPDGVVLLPILGG